jgi:hypothetical protein
MMQDRRLMMAGLACATLTPSKSKAQAKGRRVFFRVEDANHIDLVEHIVFNRLRALKQPALESRREGRNQISAVLRGSEETNKVAEAVAAAGTLIIMAEALHPSVLLHPSPPISPHTGKGILVAAEPIVTRAHIASASIEHPPRFLHPLLFITLTPEGIDRLVAYGDNKMLGDMVVMTNDICLNIGPKPWASLHELKQGRIGLSGWTTIEMMRLWEMNLILPEMPTRVSIETIETIE